MAKTSSNLFSFHYALLITGKRNKKMAAIKTTPTTNDKKGTSLQGDGT